MKKQTGQLLTDFFKKSVPITVRLLIPLIRIRLPSGHRQTREAADEKHVVFTWGTADTLTMIAFTHAGEKLWETDLGPVEGGHRFGAFTHALR